MKKSIFYDDHVKSLLDVLELYHAMHYLPEEVDEKNSRVCEIFK